MPLTPLGLSAGPEDLTDRLPEALCAVNHAEDSLLEGQAPFDQVVKHLDDGTHVLDRGLRTPEHLFVSVRRHSHCNDHLLAGHVLSVDVDSCMVAVCDTIRIDRCRIYPKTATDDIFRGYAQS